jgi:hypothetical protein
MPFSKSYAMNIAESFADFPHQAAFQRIQAFLDDEKTVKKYLKELDDGIKKDVAKFKSKDDSYSEAQAMYDIWYASFDADQGKCDSGRCVETLKEYINKNFANIKAAEAQQMTWDTSVKMTYEKKVKLGAVKAKIDSNWEVKTFGKKK